MIDILIQRCLECTDFDRDLDNDLWRFYRDNTNFKPYRNDIAYPHYSFTRSVDVGLNLFPSDTHVVIDIENPRQITITLPSYEILVKAKHTPPGLIAAHLIFLKKQLT